MIAVAAAMTTVPSCVEVQPESDGTGYLNLNVEKDAPNDTIYVSPNTKGAETEDRKIGIKIYDNVGDLVHEAEDYTAMGTLELRTGYYRAVAFSGENPTGASFDSPYYSGEQNFSIRRGQTETLDITCRLANIKVTVTLDPKIIEKFSEYKFTVTGNDSSVLEYNQDLANFSREGYFPAAVTELTWELALVSKTGIAYNTLSGTYENVKPCQHYRFNFTLKEEEPSTDIGGSIFTIILDDSLNQKEYDINLDFGKKTPVISAGDQNLDNLEHYDGDPCSISISSESHIESLVISHDDQALETAGLQRSVELAGAGADLLSELSAIGIVTDGIVSRIATKADGNPESASIDFSEFLSSLPEGRYTLNINVTNGDGAAETAMNVNVLGKRPSAVINAVSAEEVWAMFAKVKATYISQGNPEGFGFRYKAADADTWTGNSEERVVHKNGVSIKNNSYFNEKLLSHVGESVIVTYDPANIDKIAVFDMENHAICMAEAKIRTPFRHTSEEDYIRAAKEKKAARAVVKKYAPKNAAGRYLLLCAVGNGRDKAGYIMGRCWK